MELKLVECPRDAMQGLHEFIPTAEKAAYLNLLLKAGFHTLDFGSFVSPKAIPQLRDTVEVLNLLDLSQTQTQLLAIVANSRGADDASKFDEIAYLGFPFSISETFQQRNTNSSIQDSLKTVETIQEICVKSGKKAVIYLSMGFGNPYGDPWDAEITASWARKLQQMGVEILSLSDTIGVANPESISYLFSNLIPELPGVEFGAHLHTTPDTWREKVEAAYAAGCRRFDGAIKGFGGCPMAADKLTGNMPTEQMLSWFDEMKIPTGVDAKAFVEAMQAAVPVFSRG
ncbi:hydroxymethylglutaryl-CoA lyase [Bacteroidota bacterium]